MFINTNHVVGRLSLLALKKRPAIATARAAVIFQVLLSSSRVGTGDEEPALTDRRLECLLEQRKLIILSKVAASIPFLPLSSDAMSTQATHADDIQWQLKSATDCSPHSRPKG